MAATTTRAPTKAQSDYITAVEIARRMSVTAHTVRRWAETGVLPPAVRIGERILRWRRDEVETLLADLEARRA
ncbi:MAG TPA: helix-turn-helix domain-containing protein [Gemmataceae bacterium]|jgi:excisionase family DNA binding protein